MMEEKPSKSAIDRLGEVLRTKPLDAASVQELDAYRRPFEGAYDSVVAVLRDQLRLSPTGRHGKSTTAIIDKLQRETIRLSQMQDIAGCRVVVADASV